MAQQPGLVILISGQGSNLQAFIDAQASGALPGRINAVISNKPEAKGLRRAENAGTATAVLKPQGFASREAYDAELADLVGNYSPTLVILAGFMRILSPAFVDRFSGRLMNIHPSLLPKYPGLNTHQRAIDAGDAYAGATVHFVTSKLDGGPPIIRARVAIGDGETADSLAAKVLPWEHKIYPQAATWFLQERLVQQDDYAVLDGAILPASGYAYNE